MPGESERSACLLGLDFLKQYKAVIDVEKKELTLRMDGAEIKTRLFERTVGARERGYAVCGPAEGRFGAGRGR